MLVDSKYTGKREKCKGYHCWGCGGAVFEGKGYAETVRIHNPGSQMIIKPDPYTLEPTFQMIYFRLHAIKQGFLTVCRPIIGLDGCYMKGIFGGQLLATIGREGNDNNPMALALVEIESKDPWSWFLEELMGDIGSYEEMGWTFISDKQKGLTETFDTLFPSVEHRFCLGTCTTTSRPSAVHRMKMIERYDPKVGNRRTAVEWLRFVNQLFGQVKNRGMENHEGTICPNIQDKLEYLKVVSRDRFATWCGELEYEVDHYHRREGKWFCFLEGRWSWCWEGRGAGRRTTHTGSGIGSVVGASSSAAGVSSSAATSSVMPPTVTSVLNNSRARKAAKGWA
ncbi:hypothetical protein Acr_07g0009020 [Actinidia rufa]|uniref:MULE transposase domain-containing protein n=1 Tax=Actinidia rufa TaxID=165716 RepID=A0A7J0EW66_9ERIC|nr:hypothetical protein Acr_07g0009020 [Actinidia rufa]